MSRMRLQKGLYLISVAILIGGLIGAIAIYWAAMNEPEGSGYDVIGGFVYPGGGTYNKKYVHDLQLYGGNAAVLADRFMRWFSGLWQGTELAYTVAVIIIFVSAGFFLAARHVSHSKSGVNPGDNGDKLS